MRLPARAAMLFGREGEREREVEGECTKAGSDMYAQHIGTLELVTGQGKEHAELAIQAGQIIGHADVGEQADGTLCQAPRRRRGEAQGKEACQSAVRMTDQHPVGRAP